MPTTRLVCGIKLVQYSKSIIFTDLISEYDGPWHNVFYVQKAMWNVYIVTNILHGVAFSNQRNGKTRGESEPRGLERSLAVESKVHDLNLTSAIL